ncbi:MAG: hypothetical protein C0393_06475, partial [Anaerolinea sp.]|nr:hypothetical protein [Anaerolinea sp.]
MKVFVSKIFNKPWFYLFALLLVGLIAYGLMIPRLGFYWDDWEGVYLYHLHNPAISFLYYAERPLSALAYLILFPFAKMTPIVWQFVAILLRWVGVSFIYYTLTVIWPKRVWQNRWIGALLFVFPGYLNQPVSVAFSQHLTTFALFACSLFLTVLAIKDRKLSWLWMPLSVLVGMTQIFMMEYFVGLEIIRPIIIWFMFRSQPEKEKKRVFTRTLLYWLPFLVGLVIYVWWRFFYLPSTLSADPNNPILLKTILSSPVDGLTTLIENIYRDVGYLLISVWGSAFSLDIIHLHSKVTWISWFLGIV